MVTALACSRLPGLAPATEKRFSLTRMRTVFQRAAKPAVPPEQLRTQLQDLHRRQIRLKDDALGWLHFAHLDVSELVVGYRERQYGKWGWEDGKWLVPFWKRILYRTASSLGFATLASMPIIEPASPAALLVMIPFIAGFSVLTGSVACTGYSTALAVNTFQLWRTKRQLAQSETPAGNDSQTSS